MRRVYAIGDLQGCHGDFLRLLDTIDFSPERDRLWLVGDLVNRGPGSLEALRYVKALGDSAVVVLGNHDLNLLAVAFGGRNQRPKDTLEPILRAPDREELLYWLRHRPLLHHDPRLGFTMIHAGMLPQWDLALAQACAAEVEAVLRGPDYADLLRNMYGNKPNQWSPGLRGWDRLRVIINSLTRLRYCTPDGRMGMKYNGPVGTQPSPYQPWFALDGRASRGLRLVFGHWSALGCYIDPTQGVYALDSGCVWGGSLTALRLDRPYRPLQVGCSGALKPCS